MLISELKEIALCQYGIVAVQYEDLHSLTNPFGGKIIHRVLYHSMPTDDDFDELEEELQTDEELGCVGRDFVLRDATQEEVLFMQDIINKKVKELENDPENKVW